ncbi:MAG: hypothetical protein Unbinned6242contig1001_14 [Prokaryotic dsDNA virus sp.]|nr:MAG: hypothetical protein Unbinned6242contig1001_14 [Prokaryotic dsDNA virus sp.]|tara:strand:+ start:20332 stop:21204 length:873 start_codon:yes stop_codon:yes gene_type:complete
MSVEVPTAFVQKWRDDYIALSQQKGSRFRNYVRTQTGIKGKADNWERIGSSTAQQITSRHAATPLISTPHSRRRAAMGDYNIADLIDSVDRSKMLLDLEGPYMDAMLWAMGRKVDDVVISAMLGNATSVSSADAESSVALPAGQKIAHGSAGMTVAKIAEAKKILDAADVDPELPRCLAVTARQIMDLMQITQVTSADYMNVKALVDGTIDTFMGFHVIRSERLTDDGTSRQCLAWVSDGVGLSIGAEEDMKTEISTRADRNYSTQVYVEASFGCVRIEDEKVVEIACNE